MSHPKLAHIQQRYGFRCGYCGVAEEDTGGELTIDHFVPTSAGGDDSDDNLVYACFRCNVNKSDLLPGAVGDTLRLLHPKRDDLTVHIREEPDGLLVDLTETGRFHIAMLRLNRPALIAYRKNQALKALNAQALDQIVAENTSLRVNLTRLELYVANLEERLGMPPEPET